MAVELNDGYLTERAWQFFREGVSVADEFLFLRDGKIGGYQHFNEKTWAIREGNLTVLNGAGRPTCQFSPSIDEDGLTILDGCHIPYPVTLRLKEKATKLTRRPGTRDALHDKSTRYGWNIGDHTYGLPGFIEAGYAGLTIGKYTSIAGGVKICFANHNLATATTYPFASLQQFWPGVPPKTRDHVVRGPITIGHDVWLGTDALILPGVQIGSGAVIGAGSIVTHDVPPYAVALGSPSRVVRYRFEEWAIARLLELEWWHLPDDVVNSLLPHMMLASISEFLDR